MIAIVEVLAALAAAGNQPILPEWMAGCWEERRGEQWTEECWTQPRAGLMLGSARSGKGERLLNWEAMQIMLNQRDGSRTIPMVFWAAPKGSNRTLFAWQPHEKGVTFYNVANDYPQRVHYWREGDLLKAETAMADGSRPMRWTYRRR